MRTLVSIRPGCGEGSSNTCARGGTGLLACPSAGYKYVMSYYERNLPHWQPEGAAMCLTWRLHGSLPRTVEILEQGLVSGSLVYASCGRGFRWSITFTSRSIPKPACRGSPKPSRIIRRARPMPSLRIIGRTGSPFWQECGGRKSWPRSFAISRRIRWWRAGEQRGTFTYDRWDRPPGLSFCHARTPDRGRRSHWPVAVVKRLDCSSAERTRRTRRPGVATDSAAFPMSRKLSGIGGRVPISAEPRTSLSGRFASC